MSVTATVTVTLNFKVSSSWGDTCTVAQIKKQAIEAADRMLIKALERDEHIEVRGVPECVSINYRE